MRNSLLLAIALLSGCAYFGYLKDPVSDIPNYAQVDDVLYRGGVPKDAGWKKIKDSEIKTVISLCDDDGQEQARVEALGLKFMNIPMSVYKRPTDDQVYAFLNAVLIKENQPVFLHCQSGRDRTGAMVAFYRAAVSGWSLKEAYNEAKRMGFWPYHGDEELKKFILQLKDKPEYFSEAARLMEENK